MTVVDTLARTLWGEARGEGARGMHAVANVVMNRVAAPGWWGNDVLSVCTHPWQFSCWDKGDPNYEKIQSVDSTDPQFAEALAIAQTAVDGRLADITLGATSYKATWEDWPVDWPMPPRDPLVVIGGQQFYDLT